jgi:hypothetical protein
MLSTPTQRDIGIAKASFHKACMILSLSLIALKVFEELLLLFLSTQKRPPPVDVVNSLTILSMNKHLQSHLPFHMM